MAIVKDIEKIQNHLRMDKPLWICLEANTVLGMAIGWIMRLARNSLIAFPSEKNMKNYEFMIVEKDAERIKNNTPF